MKHCVWREGGGGEYVWFTIDRNVESQNYRRWHYNNPRVRRELPFTLPQITVSKTTGPMFPEKNNSDFHVTLILTQLLRKLKEDDMYENLHSLQERRGNN